MKNKRMFLGIILFLVLPCIVQADVYIVYDNGYWKDPSMPGRSLSGAGQRLGPFATRQQAQDVINSRPEAERLHMHIIGSNEPAKNTTPSVAPAAKKDNVSQDMAKAIVGSFLEELMNDITAPSSPSPEEIAAQQRLIQEQQEKARQAEKEKQEALKRWDKLQKESDAEKAQRTKKGKDLLGRMDKTGSGGGQLTPFDWEKVDDRELKPLSGEVLYPAPKSAFKQLLGAAYFLQNALNAFRDEDEVSARYLNEQAGKIMSGQPTDIPCGLPDFQNIPEPDAAVAAQYVENLKIINRNMKNLQDIEINIRKEEVKIKKAQDKKSQVDAKLAEAQKITASDAPEDKNKAKSLEDELLALQREAEQELAQAIQAKKQFQNEKETNIAEINDANKQMAGNPPDATK